jgi:hypothetical protein
MKKSAKLLSVITACAIAINLLQISVFNAAAANGIAAEKAPFSEKQFEILRGEFFEDVEIGEKQLDLETIYVDSGNIKHVSQADLPQPELIPYSEGEMSASDVVYSGPYYVNDVRPFFLNGVGNGVTVNGKLMAQGEHTNVWVIDNDDWLAKVGTAHNAGEVTVAMAQDIAARFDPIYEAMTDEQTGFAKHANVQIKPGFSNAPLVGDMGDDGKVNFVLYDIYGDNIGLSGSYTAGFFTNGDFFTYNGSQTYNALDMLHIDIGQGYRILNGSEEDKLSFYGTLAHEFQHMLFYMYFGLYNSNNTSAVTGRDLYSWINESLAQCAALYYLQPGYEVLDVGETIRGVKNNYSSSNRYGDFVNYDGDKSYGIGLMLSSIFYKKAAGLYPHKVYDYLRQTYPPATSYTITSSYRTRVSANSMAGNVGDWFNYALSLGINGGETAFAQAIRLFMESYAADGGSINGVNTTKMYNSSASPVDNLWAWRTAMSYPDGAVFVQPDGGYGTYYPNYYSRQPVPALSSGENAVLKGFGTTPAEGATQDKVYKLSGENQSTPVLSISINDNNAATNYYVAVLNDEIATSYDSTYTNGFSGAALYHLTANSTPQKINTNGKPAWLFIATVYRNVDTPVTYGWETVSENELYGTAEFDNENPRYDDTITATVKDMNGEDSALNDLTYTWKVGGVAVSPDTVSNNYQNSYTVKAADIGKSISVEVTSASKNQGSLTAQTAPVGKMINIETPIPPTTVSKTDTIITLTDLGDNYEYSIGGLIWQDISIFSGLTAETTYDFYSRIKETATTEASVLSAVHRETTAEFIDYKPVVNVLTYTVLSNKATITDCLETATSEQVAVDFVEIEKRYTITGIGYQAFYDCDYLETIIIPDNVISIGNSAFRECKSLTSITLPDNLISIGNSAFYFCSSLLSIKIPEGVTIIVDSAFYCCYSLTSVTIPDGVTSIGDSAFDECTSLTSVAIPNSVTSIGRYAFYYCTSLTSVTIPASVTSIAGNAFVGSTLLTIYGTPNSYAETYANANNIPFVPIENEDPLPGDTSGDGKVTNIDVVLLKQYLAGWEVTVSAGADANGDGKINNIDVILLKQYLAGWEVTLGS